MYEGVKHIHSLGLLVDANLVIDDVWGDGDERLNALRTYISQLNKLVYYYHSRPDLPRPDLLFHDIKRIFNRRSEEGVKAYCGAGTFMTCWSADETSYPCMRFAPICTSRPLQQINEQSVETVNEKCATCIFDGICPTCEGYNYEINGSCLARTDFHCEFFKLEMIASARLCLLDEKAYLLENEESEYVAEKQKERLQKLLAIKTINDNCKELITELGY
jgi:hypothetical protein